MKDFLGIWVVYDHPIDIPDWFVARRDTVGASWPDVPVSYVFDKRLNALRRTLARRGLTCLPREVADDPKIVECWL